MIDSLLGEGYEVRQEIGSGGFGRVCIGYDHQREKKVAIKLEKVDELKGKISSIKKEEEVYSYLMGEASIGIAEIHQFGADLIDDDPDNSLDDNVYMLHYMVMDLLGPDLEELFTKCSQKFSLKTVLLLADQMIRIIQYVHSKDYIHGDIKPGNFVLGPEKTHNMIYMVDFGLAQRYRDSHTKEHIAYSDTASGAGTTKFSSLNCHQRIQQSRRDDLESLGNVLLYFLRGSLPWQGIEGWSDKRKKRRLVYEKKESISIEELCTGVPCEFASYMVYCRSLPFDEEPDYDYLRKLFQDLYNQAGFTDVLEYDWTETLRSNQGIFYGPRKYYQKEHYNSSELKPEDVFFFCQSLYKPMPEQSDLCLESTEQCLEQLLKFVSDPGSFNPEREFEWRGETMEELLKRHVEHCEDIAWIHKWDNIDWKTAGDEEKKEKVALFKKVSPYNSSKLEIVCLDFMKGVYNVYADYFPYQKKKEAEKSTLTDSNKKKTQKKRKIWISEERSETVKAFIEKLANLSTANNFVRNGLCSHTLTVMLQKEDIGDEYIQNRCVAVEVQPDGVFINPLKKSKTSLMQCIKTSQCNLWSMVVEIYGTFNDDVMKHQDDDAEFSSPPSASYDVDYASDDSAEDQSGNNLAHKDPNTVEQYSTEEFLSKPVIKKNKICSSAFRKKVRAYIEKSVPNGCLDKHTIFKMTGQHIIQLFAQVKQNSHIIMQIPGRLVNGVHEYQINGERFQKAIGMYVVNEYIYFSRLDIAPFTLEVITAGIHALTSEFDRNMYKQNPPLISFSNFRFDITKKNHRLALIIFIRSYLFAQD